MIPLTLTGMVQTDGWTAASAGGDVEPLATFRQAGRNAKWRSCLGTGWTVLMVSDIELPYDEESHS